MTKFGKLFCLVAAIGLMGTFGCGGDSESTIEEKAAQIEAPTDNPDEEPDMSEGP